MNRIVKIKGKFYDTKTSNTTFLKVARDLKKVGIKNWYFMLEIKDTSLVGVDPYQCDENGNCTLTKDQISRIIMEISRNIWYYLREVCRIPEPGCPGGVPYRANRGNIAQAWCLLHGVDSWLCLPRQQGKTVSALAAQAWVYSFGTNDSSFIFVNKDGDNAKENLRRIIKQLEILPVYLRFESIMDEDGKITKATKNATRIQHPVTKNNITIKSKATSYDSALSLARGLTASIIHFDEPEFTNHIKTIVENSVSTFNTAAQRSKENGAIYGRIFTCTPGDLDTKMGMEAQLLLESTRPWTEDLYDMNEQEIEEYVTADNSNHIVYIEYSYQQIGKTEEWFRNISAEIANPLVVRREILLQRLRGSDTSPYPREDIDYIIDAGRIPISEIYLQNYYKMDIYEELDRSIPYIVGIDCSTGTVNDNNAMTIINPYTVRPAAEFECSYVGETMYERIIMELIKKYIPRGILCIERNSVGDGIIDHLIHSPIAPNLYFDKDRDLMSETMKDNETIESMLKREAKKKSFYGVYTEGKSRESMFAILARRVNENKEDFVSKNVIRDLSRLVRSPSGKIVAGPGFHDDSIMSYLIGLYVYYHGNNLALFGFVKGSDEEIKPNQGLTRPEDVNMLHIDGAAASNIRTQLEKEQNTLNYEEMLRRAVASSQRESLRLSRANLANNHSIDNTPDYLIDGYDGDTGTIGMDFFDEMNGITDNNDDFFNF